MGKDSNFDIVYREEVRDWIPLGRYIFFQRREEYGGGYWLGQVYADWFSFVVEEPVSLHRGMQYLISIKSNEEGIMKFDDSLDNFMLTSE
ncbi:hypothetical protein J1781_18875 [Rahnella sp. C60]|uniref:hypothetical protein n=1 Tax=Rahnella perminowiae TaxID=2816244 RepID=UPI001C25CA1D|nr:hypothetical protein [Rahnella perminowiae]MBU9816890.1 hypothetical protein [Rahnella perminowiae]MBU9823565.1 hypothetical protein [Rahnella perminowiae]MCR9000441.1 hypothetical protein [Rahnella perminowiae]MCX2943758.1 hypothetical protein [Rahnella perminowiae]